MQRMIRTFTTKILPAQSMKLFTAAKSPKRSWTYDLLCLTAVRDACGDTENLFLDNIVHYAHHLMAHTHVVLTQLKPGGLPTPI